MPEETRREAFTVNLSSGRVRNAMQFVEGLRAGQELGALLGYQLERGLHENHPGLELDTFISLLRERFPFVSKRLTDVPDGTAAEVIEARNVIDGYDLRRAHPRQDLSLRHCRPAGRGICRGSGGRGRVPAPAGHARCVSAT